MNAHPPKRALRFLRWFCREDYLEEIEGNLIELFEKQYTHAPKRANRLFYWDVLRHFRPDYIRKFNRNHLIHYGMLQNYFKIAWRSMLRQKLYSFVNISGLAIGLTAFLLIFLYVQHERSYDRFFSNNDQIYRAYQQIQGNEYQGSDLYALTTVGLAPTLTSDFPEVTDATTFQQQASLLSFNDHHYYEDGLWADAHFFKVFPYPFVQGDPQTALEHPQSIVLSQSLARKLFGQADPLNQSLVFRNGDDFLVTGIIADPPANSSMQFSFLAAIVSSRQYDEEIKGDRWNNNDYHTFFTLAEEADPLTVQAKLAGLVDRYIEYPDDYPFKNKYFMQPLSELHFETNVNFDIGKKGNSKYVSLFSLIAILVLLLACANYMNLAIARSIKRAGEVGLRKVVGAKRGQLIGQFLGESIFIAFIALLLALGLTDCLAPVFGNLLERPLELNLLENIYLLPGLLLLVILAGIISGSYPAFFMSSIRPVQALRGKVGKRVSGTTIQRWLMVGQYAVAIVLILGSLVIFQQFRFIQNKELGFQKDHILTIPVTDSKLAQHFVELKNEWAQNPNIISVTAAAELPTNVTSNTRLRLPHENKEEGISIYRARVNYGYLEVFGIPLLAGRDFSEDIKTDFEEALIINESAAKAMGWTATEAIGKKVSDHKSRTVIGVVKDFHMHSMHLEIAPLMLVMDNYMAHIAVKVTSNRLQKTVSELEGNIQHFSVYPFQYQFLDERFNQLYQSEIRLGEMFGFFTVLSILIASLGLFGMAAFMATQRTREIGIRKVLGASAQQIIGTFSKDFLKIVLVGFTIAMPIAWYTTQRWLQDFAYRISLEWWMFAMVGLGVIVLSFLTISSQSMKVALANPVKALRNE